MNTTYAPPAARTDHNSAGFRSAGAPPRNIRYTQLPEQSAAAAAPPPSCPYSDRQIEVLKLLAEGFSSAECAGVLEISTETVRTHRQHILHRSDRRNMVSLIVQAVRLNWI